MTRSVTIDLCNALHLSLADFEAIPWGRPVMLSDQPIGTKWRERIRGSSRVCIRRFYGISHDGPLIVTYSPVIRVPAVTRLVPRQQVSA